MMAMLVLLVELLVILPIGGAASFQLQSSNIILFRDKAVSRPSTTSQHFSATRATYPPPEEEASTTTSNNNNIPSLTITDSNTSNIINRRTTLFGVSATAAISWMLNPQPSIALQGPKKRTCTDIETCREIGEQKDAADLQANPVIRLSTGVRYKILKEGVGTDVVKNGSSIDLIYSLSRAGGQYMYSQGFGYEQIDVVGNGQLVKDSNGLDSLRVNVGKHEQVPIGIEDALRGMKKGERRRVELPPSVGLETSNWEPSPKTTAGKQSIKVYRRILEGFGSQPPFAAPTIWDIEVIKIRS